MLAFSLGIIRSGSTRNIQEVFETVFLFPSIYHVTSLCNFFSRAPESVRVAAVGVVHLAGSAGVSRLACARVPARDLSGSWLRISCEFLR